MADNNFEQQLHKQMEQFKLRPSDAVWQNVDAQLRKDKRRRWFFFLLSTTALLGITGSIAHTSQKQQTTSKQIASAPLHAKVKTIKNNTSTSLIPATPLINSEEKTESIPNQIHKTATGTAKNNLTEKTNLPSLKSRKQSLRIILTAQPQKRNGSAIHQSTAVQTDKAPVIVFTPSSQKTATATAEKQDTSAEPAHLPQSAVSIPSVVDNNNSTSLSNTAEKETIQNEINKKPKDSSSTQPAASGTEKEKRRWQKGLQFNVGLADIVESILPGSEYKRAESIPYFTGGGTAASPANVSGITFSEYNVASRIHIGAAYLLRKKIFKQSFFVTGIQYQYNRFTVNERISRDTFSVAQNRLINDFSSEQKNSFDFHYISIPTEIQWHLTTTTKGNMLFGTGLLHSFRIASTNALPVFINNSSGAAFYQPTLQLTPSYEWSTKKSAMQLGWYFNYGLFSVYNNTSKNHWWQTGLRLQYYFRTAK